MNYGYDYNRDQWVWRKDANELAYERAVRQEIDRVRNLRRPEAESYFYENAYDKSYFYENAYDREKKFRYFR